MRFTRPHRRSLACLVLGAWLFALAVGVANACIAAQSAVAGDPCHASAAAHGPNQPTPQPCAKFCNDNTPLPAKSIADDGFALAVQMPTATPALDVSDVAAAVGAVVPAAPASTVPLYLRSLRLAL